ncbi:hypothetical protein BH20ACT2_BH20ACT2_13020 [soil metagenome]
MADHPETAPPEERTQAELAQQGAESEPDDITAREGLETALMEADASDAGRDLGEAVD